MNAACLCRVLLVAMGMAFEAGFSQIESQSSTPDQSPGLVLDRNWNSSLGIAAGTVQELTTLIGKFVKPQVNLASDPSLEIYGGVTYLMPFKDAVNALKLKMGMMSRNSVSCPGFPKSSLFYYTFSGQFDEGFNILNIVVDKADQVVSIQFVSESPNKALFSNVGWWASDDKGWHTYNFINYRNKAVKTLMINHNVYLNYQVSQSSSIASARKREWIRVSGSRPLDPSRFDNLRIDTMLIDIKSRPGYPSDGKPLEAVRWYLPVPLAQTMLYSITQSNGGSSAF